MRSQIFGALAEVEKELLRWIVIIFGPASFRDHAFSFSVFFKLQHHKVSFLGGAAGTTANNTQLFEFPNDNP